MTEPVDEYCIQSMPEFDGKNFQNVAKEGVKLDEGEKSKQAFEALEKIFEPLVNWLKETGLKNMVNFINLFFIYILFRLKNLLFLNVLLNRHQLLLLLLMVCFLIF